MAVYSGFVRVGFVMLIDENSFEHDGIKYTAINRKTCSECFFEFVEPCIVCGEQPYCMSSMRKDGKDVIWKKQATGNG
jgi:hypothetical protein